MRSIALVLSLVLVTGIVGACTATAPPSPVQTARPIPTSPPTLGVYNGTTIAVKLKVNGADIQSFAASERVDPVPVAKMPALPWDAEVTTVNGRVLVRLAVKEGDVTGSRGVAARVDLSCGRIDVYAGPPLGGPGLQPGTPGDCDP